MQSFNKHDSRNKFSSKFHKPNNYIFIKYWLIGYQVENILSYFPMYFFLLKYQV